MVKIHSNAKYQDDLVRIFKKLKVGPIDPQKVYDLLQMQNFPKKSRKREIFQARVLYLCARLRWSSTPLFVLAKEIGENHSSIFNKIKALDKAVNGFDPNFLAFALEVYGAVAEERGEKEELTDEKLQEFLGRFFWQSQVKELSTGVKKLLHVR